MADDVLLRFLDANLIGVGGDDAKFAKLQESAADLATALQAEPRLTIGSSLIAFDPDAPADDPAVMRALAALRAKWPTYSNTVAGQAVTFARVILLDALSQAAVRDDRIAAAFVAMARNVLPHAEGGEEQPIWADMVADLERRVDERAEAEWATPSSIAAPEIRFETGATITPTTESKVLDEKWLGQQVAAAIGPTVAGVQTGGNPHWPQANTLQQWATEFSSRLTEAMKAASDAMAKGVTVAPIDLGQVLGQFASSLADHAEELLSSVASATEGLQRRTHLIWWKEALFSPSMRVSYRQLPSFEAAALMAFDLHQLVPSFSPASVAAFLDESVRALHSDKPVGAEALGDLARGARIAEALAPLRAAARSGTSPVGRGPVLALAGYPETEFPADTHAFRARTGARGDVTLTPSEWASWTFRELQALRAVGDAGERA